MWESTALPQRKKENQNENNQLKQRSTERKWKRDQRTPLLHLSLIRPSPKIDIKNDWDPKILLQSPTQEKTTQSIEKSSEIHQSRMFVRLRIFTGRVPSILNYSSETEKGKFSFVRNRIFQSFFLLFVRSVKQDLFCKSSLLLDLVSMNQPTKRNC